MKGGKGGKVWPGRGGGAFVHDNREATILTKDPSARLHTQVKGLIGQRDGKQHRVHLLHMSEYNKMQGVSGHQIHLCVPRHPEDGRDKTRAEVQLTVMPSPPSWQSNGR